MLPGKKEVNQCLSKQPQHSPGEGQRKRPEWSCESGSTGAAPFSLALSMQLLLKRISVPVSSIPSISFKFGWFVLGGTVKWEHHKR